MRAQTGASDSAWTRARKAANRAGFIAGPMMRSNAGAFEGRVIDGRLVVKSPLVRERHPRQGRQVNDGLRERAGPARSRLLHDPNHAAHERRVGELTSHQRQRAPRREHARDLMRGELRVQEVERVGDDHEVEAGRLERQLFGGRVERAQRDPALRRRRAKLIEHRLRGLNRHHVEATGREREREMTDAGPEIADAATAGPASSASAWTSAAGYAGRAA